MSRLTSLAATAVGLVVAVALVATPSDALACCTPCSSACGFSGATPDTICCTGQPTPCDGCGTTACGACAWQSKLDAGCAAACATEWLGCIADGTTGGCYGEWGFCVDACWSETFVCEQPPCPIECEDDEHEEDDTLAMVTKTPPIMNPAGGKPTHLAGLVAQAFDDDWFHAYADCCSVAWAVLTWDPDAGELALGAVDEAGNPWSVGDEGFVQKVKPGYWAVRIAGYGGHFYLRVTNVEGDCVPYDLEVYAPVYLF